MPTIKGLTKLKKSIVVRDTFAGLHCWPEAPEDVEYLRYLHRHLFKVAVHFRVEHSDRFLEFFMVKTDLSAILALLGQVDLLANPHMSCEMMAEYILEGLFRKGYNTAYKVTVSEDGENDGTVEIDSN